MRTISDARASFIAIIVAAFLFSICNVAYRSGEGSALLVAAERSWLGVILLTPVLHRIWTSGKLREVLDDKVAILAVVGSGMTLISSPLMFRGIPGPQAALVIAVLPALLIVPAHFVTRRDIRRAVPLIGISVIAASIAAVSGGLGPLTAFGLGAIALYIATDMVSMLSAELARARHDALTMVALGTVLGALSTTVLVGATGPPDHIAMSGFIAALIVATFGTVARTLLQFALPHVGSVVSISCGQLNAVLTAAGGILIFGDELDTFAGLVGVVAAVAAVLAALRVLKPAESTVDPAA